MPTSGCLNKPAWFSTLDVLAIFIEGGQLAGFPSSQLVDFNYFKGSLNDLTAFVSRHCASACDSTSIRYYTVKAWRHALCNRRQYGNDRAGRFAGGQITFQSQLDSSWASVGNTILNKISKVFAKHSEIFCHGLVFSFWPYSSSKMLMCWSG